MFERFSDRARRTVVLAQEEARRLQHNYIGTEHILLGIIREGEGIATEALRSLDIDLDALRREVEALIGRGAEQPAGHIPFTPRAKKTLELALRESVQLKSGYIGTEHILLGLIRESEGVAGQVLIQRGVILDRAREEVARLLGAAGGERRGVGTIRLAGGPDQISRQLQVISLRLAAIETKLGIEESPAKQRLRQVETGLERVRRHKDLAIDEQDFERAARLREQEKKLIASRREAEGAWLAEEDAAESSRQAPPDDEPGEETPAASA